MSEVEGGPGEPRVEQETSGANAEEPRAESTSPKHVLTVPTEEKNVNEKLTDNKRSGLMSKLSAKYKSMSKDDIEKSIKAAEDVVKRLEDAEKFPGKELEESRLLTGKAELQKLFAKKDRDWIHKLDSNQLVGIRQILQRDIQELRVQQQSPSITDSEVIEHASAGCLLRGLRQDGEGGWTRCERRLVCVPEGVRLAGSQIADEAEEYEFYEASQFDSFLQSHVSTGRSVSSKVEANVFIVKVKGGLDNTHQEENARCIQTNTKATFYSKSRIVFVPTAACYLLPDKLSQEAKEDLEKIKCQLRCLGLPGTVSSIRDFMTSFGSHVTSGTVHFGGILASEASYQCVEGESQETSKSLVTSALDTFLRVGVGAYGGGSVSYSNLKIGAGAEGMFTSQQMSRVFIRTKKVGGPIEVNSEPLWRSGLASVNRQWHVIKCGTEFVAVWDLIASEGLDSGGDLAQVFESVWQRDHPQAVMSTGAPNEFEQALKSYDSFLAEFAENAHKSGSSSQWSEFLKKLLEKISKIEALTAIERLGTVWTSNEGLGVVLREFLMQKNELLESPESERIISYLRRLIKMSATDFPEKRQIVAAISSQAAPTYRLPTREKTATSPEQFVDLLRIRYLPDMQRFLPKDANEVEEINVLQIMQPELTLSVSELLRSLAKQNYKQFVVACVFAFSGFNLSDGQFNHLLAYKEVQKLADSIESEAEATVAFEESKEAEFIQAKLLLVYCKYLQMRVEDSDCRKQLLNICEDIWLENIREITDAFVKSGCNDWQSLNAKVIHILQQYDKDGRRIHVNLNPLVQCVEKHSEPNRQQADRTSIPVALFTLEPSTLKALGLHEFWPGKLSMSAVMSFSTETDSATTDSIGLRMIKQLAMTNYNFRDSSVILIQRSEDAVQESSEDVWSDDYKPETLCSAETIFLPFCDALLFGFLSANPRLQQTLTEKLFDCKLAIPILYSFGDCKLLFTWNLRGLVLKFAEPDEPGSSKELILDNSEFPVASVIRLGTSSFSKSRIANKCLSKKHETFTVSGKNSLKKKQSDGSIELAWMLPSAGDTSGLQNAICLLNLRGDAMMHSEQREFLASVSSCLVVVLPDEDCGHSDEYSQVLLELYTVATRLVILVSSKNIPKCLRDLQQTFKSPDEKSNLDLVRLKSGDVCREDSDIAKKLQQVMFQTQDRNIFSSKLASLAQFHDFGRRRNWVVDDATDHVRGSIESAQLLMENICRSPEDLAGAKQRVLPLHGRPCIEISKRKSSAFG